MKPNTFISYSRQCIGFVDDLAHKLAKQGFNVWLDYLSLVPGRPWLEQIHKGLEEAELLLLVVSPESISSRSVEIEWRHFLEQKKRIILLVFQAVPLPPELTNLEWVDFRGGFSSAFKKLSKLINSPIAVEKPAPQSGFRAPAMVWLAAGLSVITSIYSFFAFWTFLIPWVLIPLPARILKRNFNISQTQTALWTLPIALFFSFGLGLELGIINADADFDYSNRYSLYNFILFFLFMQVFFVPFISVLLMLLLRSPAMQRWGRPEATLPKFANIYHAHIVDPRPVRYYVDHAEEDSRIARELSSELNKYGHTSAEGLSDADEVLVLISRFKSATEADPEKQVVYPILIQKTRLQEKLSKVQWIDFRKGVRNLEAIAKLLPQPAKMLAAIGVRPTSSGQGSMPNIVLALVDFLIIMGMVDLGSFLLYMLELINLNVGLIAAHEMTQVLFAVFCQLICAALSGGLIYFMIRSLSERQGWFASPIPFLFGIAAVLVLFTGQGMLGDQIDSIFRQYGVIPETLFAYLPFLSMILGLIIVGAMSLLRIRTLHHWFPVKAGRVYVLSKDEGGGFRSQGKT